MFKRMRLWKIHNYNKKIKRELKEICFEEIKLKNYIIIDVRTSKEFSEGHLNGAYNIELSKLKRKINDLKLKKEDNILVCCRSGVRSKKAVIILEELGYINVYNLNGGLENI